ncbi:type II toxin-antitoxin system PemK/MazF family toxin [Antribacter sp. KLBMP9083]|uniref:Type II toxin-antitoxin system PemK/MazF family toxin n=1 Tax=Antribacter soli TaxID=2910976 RepID=A0AA41QF80_9MICO|nr:type II toxin-antitoxin system PemK/MazF family toxin [Antribacter soli]MCF4121566.1 type II toxin-antitoxin system PemK/MazF family toxin [Antribacter soli]
MTRNPWLSLLEDVVEAVKSSVAESPKDTGREPARVPAPGPSDVPARPRPARAPASAGRAPRTVGYPGDFDGTVEPVYAPDLDGEPDPGEVVWTWVPYEEDHAQGKDRPVLLVGHDGPWLLALQLTSQDHDRDAEQEARAGRIWFDIGSGPWDREGRRSEVRINRVIRVHPDAVRREGAIVPRGTFDDVVKYMHRALDLT